MGTAAAALGLGTASAAAAALLVGLGRLGPPRALLPLIRLPARG
ncbi:hypothetical protein BV133_3306 [Blastochloris viridis]|uniref:Uncharacterized protein n=1 Tax=Blastochloris viridis TaxID=1079 RepID=A0A182D605_BLAVI|nr:hypothetical protein BV133_3306 [Blastochloris viridis]